MVKRHFANEYGSAMACGADIDLFHAEFSDEINCLNCKRTKLYKEYGFEVVE